MNTNANARPEESLTILWSCICIVLAITRHHAPEGNCSEDEFEVSCNHEYMGSHDTFMIYLTEPIPHAFLKELEYDMASRGSEKQTHVGLELRWISAY